MTGRDHLVTLADAFSQALNLKRTTLSWHLFQDTNKLDAIVNGKDLYLGRYERAMRYFADHWPADLAWPAGIPRPTASAVAQPVDLSIAGSPA